MTPQDQPISSTFQHLTGIGQCTERSLWERGITDWTAFRCENKIDGISCARKHLLDWEVDLSIHMINAGCLEFFAKRLPGAEMWRLYPNLKSEAAFLDIETEGLHRSAKVTVVGVALGNRFTTLIRGVNLTGTELDRALSGAKAIVTFNGTCFDIPILAREFPGCVPAVPHLDLRYMSRRVGLKGGLKLLEYKLGIARDPEVQMLAGDDAVRLWRVRSRKRHKRALELLVDYNREDVLNMRPLADEVYSRLLAKLKEQMKAST